VLTLLLASTQYEKADGTRGWIETKANIHSAKLRATSNGDYHLDLDYRYRAGPRDWTGVRIAPEPTLTREAGYDYATRFRPGVIVPVWFDPAVPSSAVLERPRIFAPRLVRALGATLLAAGLSPFALQLFRDLRHRRERHRLPGLLSGRST
jgi:hypothetical protein